MNNNFEIDIYNQYNLPEGVRSSVCPFCSSSRKKKLEKCISLDWNKGLGTCHHCGKKVQLHTYKKKEEGSSIIYNTQIYNIDNNNYQTLSSQHIPNNKFIEKTNLFRFLLTLFKEQDIRDIFNVYLIGASKHWLFEQGYSTIFPQIDIKGNLRQLKIIAYNPNTGKRLHREDMAFLWKNDQYIPDTFQPKVWFAGKTLLDNTEAKLKQCFFGEHLLLNNSLPIAIVESEKTALIAMLEYPQYIWIATGGKNGCSWINGGVFQVLKGREVVLFPDSDCYSEWKEKGSVLKNSGIDIKINSMLLEKYSSLSWDIADFILWQKNKI